MLKKYAVLSLLVALPLLGACQKNANNNAAPAKDAVKQAVEVNAKADGNTDKKVEDPNMKVAVINDKVITAGDLDKEFAPIRKRLTMMGANEEKLQEMRMMFLNKYIERELLLQAAAKANFAIDEAAIAAEEKKIKDHFPSEEAFNNFMAESGMDKEAFKKQIVEGYLIDKIIEKEVESKINIDEAAAKNFYDTNTDQFNRPEQLKASHILVKVEDMSDEAQKKAAKDKAADILKQVKAGGDFAALAKQFSNCPSSAQGGDLGYFGLGQMVKPFEDACLKLKVGEISDLVETQFGYHIIKLTDHKAAGKMGFDEVKDELMKQLKGMEGQKQMKSYLETLRSAAKIERFI